MRGLTSFLLIGSSLLFVACGGGEESSEPGVGAGGQGGSASGAAGKGGAGGAGQGGVAGQAGKGGSAGGGAGKSGSSGAAGKGGSAGSAGKAGSAGSNGGSAGKAGGGGSAGSSAGKAGSAGSGQGGAAGSVQGGNAGSGQGGSSAGSGQGGDAGSGQGGDAGSGAGGDAGSGAGGDAGSGQGGDGGAAGQSGSAGDGGQGGSCAGPEVCNGLDDDCDGQIDNNPTDAGKACPASGVEGACQSGTLACQGGALTCVAAAPSAEKCDGLDNDCDGVADNDPTDVGADCFTDQKGVCAPGKSACNGGVLACVALLSPTDEVCDGKDNDCDGDVDEGFAGAGQPCQVAGQQGLCQTGQTSCLNGGNSCTQTVFPGAEVCDGLDNDCDGVADNNLTDTNTPCDTGKQGVCAAGVTSCSGGSLVCAAVNLPTSEECNGLDDDCNGSVDDGLADLKCGVGECAVTTPACVDGVAQSCFPKDPVAEVCDQKDNNCDGVVDDGNVCCPVAQRCGALCCVGGDVCSFQQCVTPGKACTASEDCAGGEFCDYSLGTTNNPPPGCQGSSQKTGKCMPKPPSCAGGQDPGDPPVCVQKCEYKPPTKPFEPVLKYSWGGVVASPFDTDIMMTPIVTQLDDDDCDGKVTERDIPDIVFTTFASANYNGSSLLRAIAVKNGVLTQKWSFAGVHGTKQLASGNLDGQPGSEIVACAANGNVIAIKPDGTQLWSVATPACFMPSIADLDQDGKPEVVTEGGVYNGATGALKASFTPALGAPFVLSDIDGDGKQDVVTSGKAYRGDGSLIVDTGLAAGTAFPNTGDWKGPWAAVADFNLDGKPEVVGLDNFNHALVVWRYNPALPSKFEVVRSGLDINGSLSPTLCGASSWGRTHGGGPLTVGDFNADGTPDVAFAGGVGYAVLDGKKLVDGVTTNLNTFLWAKQTSDCSSASTGSSLFDFNGDGKAEVIYSDEFRFRVYEGATGNILFETCNTTATLIENPIVADIDNDGQADIILPSNAYARTCNTPDENGQKKAGIRVFGSKNNDWVRTRRIWNQHAYHITNINEDGSVPQVEASNWTQPGLNNFRQNKQPGGEFSAPDLVITLTPTCQGPYALVATVRNLGEAPVGAGVKVGFYTASGQKLGEASTTIALYPAGSETLSLPLGQAPAEDVYALADDNSPAHPWVECRVDNNKSTTVKPTCSQ